MENQAVKDFKAVLGAVYLVHRGDATPAGSGDPAKSGLTQYILSLIAKKNNRGFRDQESRGPTRRTGSGPVIFTNLEPLRVYEVDKINLFK